MDHYEREEETVMEGGIAVNQHQQEEGETVEVPEDQEDKLFTSLGLDLTSVTTMRVKNGSKVRNLLGFAIRKIKDEATKHIIFTGSGPAISKTITCVEIVKRNMKALHQISKIYHKRIAEYWNPKEEGLDRLKVTRHIPAIVILLSKEPLDINEPGYQAPGSFTALWGDAGQDKDRTKSQSRKRPKTEKAKQAKRTVPSRSTSGESKATPSTEEGVRRKPSSKKGQKNTKGDARGKKVESGKLTLSELAM